MIHYHGTPIAPPQATLRSLAGRHFCVSFVDPSDLKTCLEIGASVMLDNGAFSVWKRGIAPNWPKFTRWVENYLYHPHWCVIPDVIGGSEEANDELLAGWAHPVEFSAPVWHLHESLDRLRRLSDNWPKICFGSSGQFNKPGNDEWVRRVDEAWDVLARSNRKPWVHMLRAMRQASEGNWPFASADSSNLGQRHAYSKWTAVEIADKWDARNPAVGVVRPRQGGLF